MIGPLYSIKAQCADEKLYESIMRSRCATGEGAYHSSRAYKQITIVLMVGYFLQGSKRFQNSLALRISPLSASFGLEPSISYAGLLCGGLSHPLGTPAASIKMSLLLERIKQALQGLQPCTGVAGEALAKAHVAKTNNSDEQTGTESMINLAYSTREVSVVICRIRLKAEPHWPIKFRKQAQ
jgi:hypothetical protein